MGFRAEIDAGRKKAEVFYRRVSASEKTQVHRIATTVEMCEVASRVTPMSIKTTQERGDILTDQISMVRIWVIRAGFQFVAFLPTLLGGDRFLHRFPMLRSSVPSSLVSSAAAGIALHPRRTPKDLRAERIAGEASAEIAARDRLWRCKRRRGSGVG